MCGSERQTQKSRFFLYYLVRAFIMQVHILVKKRKEERARRIKKQKQEQTARKYIARFW